MKGQGSTIDSFPESVNIDQGSVSNNTSVNQQTSLNSILHPVESRLSTYTVASDGATCVNVVSHDVQSLSGWNSGEPSSRLTSQNQRNDDGMKMEYGWSTSFSACTGGVPRLEERQCEPTSVLFPGSRGIVCSGIQDRSGPLFLRGSSSSHAPQNVNLNSEYVGSSVNGGQSMRLGVGPNLSDSGGLETDRAYHASAPDKFGTSSGSSGLVVENNGDAGSSLGGSALSCKRKALEGMSGQSCSSGSTSCFPQAENGVSVRYDASSSLSLSPCLQNSPSVCPPEQPNPRFRVGMRIVDDGFPSSGTIGYTENHLRNFGRRGDPRYQQESVPFSLSSTGSTERSNFPSPHSSMMHLTFSDSMESRSTAALSANTNAYQNQPHAVHVSAIPRNVHPIPWSGVSSSRAGNISSSFISRERSAALQEEGHARSIPRNSAEHAMFVPSAEMRNMVQDPTSWSLATDSSSRGISSTTRIGSSSSIHPLPASAWIPHHSLSAPSQQRLSEFAPWSLFPSTDPDSGGHSGHFPLLSSGSSSSSQEVVIPSASNSLVHHQPQRSSFLMERQGDDVLGLPRSLQALAADIEGRNRLISEIRQVLNAMHRGENLQIEDYMRFEPFIYHSLAEMHDRHRDMRLDVDNMSYEELLALEERIGDVNTGLSEETIMQIMKQKKYTSMDIESPSDQEPCCICQEEYVDGDDLGTLDCEHDFHTVCIKQWLMEKNLCPICKTTALPT